MKKLRTITLGCDADNPSVSLCPGHVTTKVFNEAYASEGWHGGDRIRKSELFYEYWVPLKRSWRKATKDNPKAKPVTVLYW